ncbi:hypothetical protein BU26DRAFT_424058, partial [Trematosphaeria pertusa]
MSSPKDCNLTSSHEYDCDVCGSDISESDGILACGEHFYCNDCAVETFHRSLKNINEFPASCCSKSRNGLAPSLFAELLGPEFMEKYRLKLHEHYTPTAVRVYCANPSCAEYKHPKSWDNTHRYYTLARCACGTTTCVGCRKEWAQDHVCRCSDLHDVKPAWVPPYSSSSRIKQCPKCHEWIELAEACNHMICTSCKYEFCFVCQQRWRGFHDRDGCPSYGDPLEGYDAEGFEQTERGLHVYSGRDRGGYDLHGLNAF